MIRTRNISLLLFLALISGALVAQKQNVPVDSDYERSDPSVAVLLPPALVQELTAIRDAGLTDDYAYRQVAHLTENIGPRPVGSPQAQTAIEYVAAEMRKLGLDVHLEPVQARRWMRGVEAAVQCQDNDKQFRHHGNWQLPLLSAPARFCNRTNNLNGRDLPAPPARLKAFRCVLG